MDRVGSKELETFHNQTIKLQISSSFSKITQLVITETDCKLKS